MSLITSHQDSYILIGVRWQSVICPLFSSWSIEESKISFWRGTTIEQDDIQREKNEIGESTRSYCSLSLFYWKLARRNSQYNITSRIRIDLSIIYRFFTLAILERRSWKRWDTHFHLIFFFFFFFSHVCMSTLKIEGTQKIPLGITSSLYIWSRGKQDPFFDLLAIYILDFESLQRLGSYIPAEPFCHRALVIRLVTIVLFHHARRIAENGRDKPYRHI